MRWNERPEAAPTRCCKRYLLDQARQHFDARRKAIAAIKTPAGHRTAGRRSCVRSSSDRSATCPSGRRSTHSVVGTLKRDGYRVEKIIFESRPNHHVTANLYLPDGKPPFPGVLLPCGHSDNGKAYEELSARMHSAGQERHGRALLRPDRPGRAVPAARCARASRSIRGTTEHTMAGIGALLVGRQLASYRIWDGFARSTTWRAGPRSIRAAWAARATRAAAR